MKKAIVLFLSVFVVIGCAEKLIEKPSNLIPKEKMIAILKDIAILNAARSTNTASLKENGIEPTEYIFEKYEIDSITYVDSDRYYASRPLEYVSIYETVEALLVTGKEDAEKRKKLNDSLNLVKRKKEQAKDSLNIIRKAPKSPK